MDVNFELYKIFYIVALNESISKAAEVLYISQPAVSSQIKNLEDKLDLSLFIRSKKGVSLTPEGKILFEYIQKGVEQFHNGLNTITNLKNLDSGTVRIGASTTVSRYVLMPYLEQFHEKFPKIDIQIVNNLTENLIRELKNGNLDMLILNLPMKEHKELKIIPVKEVQDIFVGNKKYYEMTKGKVKLAELNKYPILFQKLPSNTRCFLDQYLQKNCVNLKPKLEVVSYNLIMDLVKSGFGIGYATKEFIEDELKNKSLYKIEVNPKIPSRFIGIVTINKSIPNYSAKKLIDIMTNKKLT